jgi:hypothetical protein
MTIASVQSEAAPPRIRGGLVPALTLFFLAPLVAEFLLGNLPITWLWVLIVLAPLYGGGALLVREIARRRGLGWPGILILGLAYGVIEEALVTQSLFNPDYLGLRLLDFGYLPSLGIGLWWTVFVLAIHVIWSIATPVALAEALSGERRRAPWLGKVGLAVVAALFLFGSVASAKAQSAEASVAFRASVTQLATSGLVVVLLVALAFAIGRRSGRAAQSDTASAPPRAIAAGLSSFFLGSAFMLLAITHVLMPAVVNVLAMLALIAFGCAVIARWGRRAAWSPRHELALAGGLLLTYAWYGFVQTPSVGQTSRLVDMVGNAIFAAGAIAVLCVASRRVQAG